MAVLGSVALAVVQALLVEVALELLVRGADALGQQVAVALEARTTLEKAKIGTRVVSMPCREWFDAQTKAYQDKVLPATVRARVSVEAATPFGWREVVGDAGEIVGIDHFGASADAGTLYEKFGITPAAVVKAAKASIKKAKG